MNKRMLRLAVVVTLLLGLVPATAGAAPFSPISVLHTAWRALWTDVTGFIGMDRVEGEGGQGGKVGDSVRSRAEMPPNASSPPLAISDTTLDPVPLGSQVDAGPDLDPHG